MKYSITATSKSNDNALIQIKETEVRFGTTSDASGSLANPAELFLSSFAACILKNIERMSYLMKFEFERAEISVKANRLEKPPRIEDIEYLLVIYSTDPSLNVGLLKKNIEQFGTIFNTVAKSCQIKGDITVAAI